MTPDVVRFRQADLLSGLYRRFGPVVRVGPYTYLLGPEANLFLFAHSELFEVERAFQSLVPVDGPTSLIVSDGEDHRRRRRVVQPALAHRQIAGYVPVMRANAEAALDGWRPGEVVDAYQEFRRAIRRSTIHALFGEELARDSDFFGAHLQVLINLIDRNPAVVKVLRTLKAPAWRDAMRARRAVDARVYQAIEETRQGKTAGDVLTSLVQGDGLSDLEVRDQIVTLIAAGYETTSGAMAWAVFNLLRHNGVWERAREDDEYLGNVVNETLRLYPRRWFRHGWRRSRSSSPGRRSSRARSCCTARTSRIGWPRCGRTRCGSTPTGGGASRRRTSSCRSAVVRTAASARGSRRRSCR